MKRSLFILLTFAMILSMAAGAATDNIDKTSKYLISIVDNPTVSSIGGEWTIIGLARSGEEIPKEYFEKYYLNVVNCIKTKKGVLHSRKHTEYSRVILALRAIGKNPEKVAGYNLVTPLLDYDKTVFQGVNGAIWALIALDSGDYADEEIREKYILHILQREKNGGGWAILDEQKEADVDVTAMALVALSNYKDRKDVKNAIDRGISVLSAMQNANGGYLSYNTESSESSAQVLTALSALEISHNDARFTKNGNTIVTGVFLIPMNQILWRRSSVIMLW